MKKLLFFILALYIAGCATPPLPPQPRGEKVLINKQRANTNTSALLVDDTVQIPSINNTDVAIPVMEKVNPNEFNNVAVKGASK